MGTTLKQLFDAKKLSEIHRIIHDLEYSSTQLNNIIISGRPCKENYHELIAYSYLTALQSFNTGTVPEFKKAVRPLEVLTHPVSPVERYLAGRGNCLLAMHNCRMGRLPDAERHVTLANAFGQSLHFTPLTIEMLLVDSQIKTRRSDWPQAILRAKEALSIAQKSETKDIMSEANAWRTLGQARFDNGDFEAARQHLETALGFYNEYPFYLGQAQTQLLLAHLYYHISDYESHNRVLEGVEHLCRSFNFLRELGTAQRYRGKFELYHKNVKKAVECFKESLQTVEALQDPSISARNHLSLARAYMTGRKRKEALKEYNEAERGFKEAGDNTHIATTTATKALLLAQTRPPAPRSKVEALFRKAIKIFDDHRDRRHKAAILYEMGMQYRRWEKYGLAVKYFTAAVDCASTMHAEMLIKRYQTKQHISEADREWSNRLAKAVKDRENSIFQIQNVAHDIGNLLDRLSTPLQMMRRYKTIQEAHQSALDMENAGLYIANVITGLRKCLNPEKLQLELEPLKLKPVIESTIRIVAFYSIGSCKNLIFLNKSDENDIVFADKAELQRILVNLMGNSAKFTEDGGTITVSTSKTKEPNMLQITLRDTGCGMHKKIRKKVFDLDAQARLWAELEKESRSGTADRGYGIGIVYCAKAIEKHGGRIWVDPDETRRKEEDLHRPDYHGTVIHFTLPTPVKSQSI